MKLLTIDLDNVIFDVSPIYKKAVYLSKDNVDWRPKCWDINKAFPPATAKELKRLFNEEYDLVAPGRIIGGQDTVNTINNLIANKEYVVKFVTDRPLHLPTYQQLQQAGFKFNKSDLHICYGRKIDVLKVLRGNYDSHIHIDDCGEIIEQCKKWDIIGILISNDDTPYNHYLKANSVKSILEAMYKLH